MSITNERNGNSATKVTTSSYTTDRGLLSSQVTWAETPMATTVNFTHNSYGNVTQTQTLVPNRPPVTATSTFDGDQRYIVTTSITCDNKTRTSSTTNHPFWGTILSKTDGDGGTGSLTTTYEYDAMGRLKKTTTPLGHQIQESYVWDVSGEQAFFINSRIIPTWWAPMKRSGTIKEGSLKRKPWVGTATILHRQKLYDSCGRDKASTIPIPMANPY